jgi:hypothetical protein
MNVFNREPLTVKGLISILEYLPGDLPVGVEDNHFNKYEFDAPRVSHTAVKGPERVVINVLSKESSSLLRPFDSSDWDGFAGACALPDRSGPFIRETETATIILSGDENHENSIAVDVYLEDQSIFGYYFDASSEFAKLFCNALQESDMTPERLTALGFNRY